MSLSYLFLLFIIYSVTGWICEVVYCSIIERRFVNRGFLLGPLCPVYGFGGILVIFLLKPFSDNIFYLFTMAVVVTSALEYVTGWALETIFSTKWWDYSHFRFNVHGRVCLLNSLMFGAMSVIGVRLVHPAIVSVLGLLSSGSIDVIALAMLIVLVADIVITLRALVDLRAKFSAFAEFLESIKETIDVREWFNELDHAGSLDRIRARARIDASGTLQSLAERFERLIHHPRGVVRLLSAFPSLKKGLSGSSSRAAKHEAPPAPCGLYEYFWVFLSASFIGVVLETAWCVLTTGQIQNRSGLLYGMLNPLYGGGAVLMTAILVRPGKKRDIFVLFGGMLLGAGFEYLCSFAQEFLFGSISWEYTGTQLNIQGRTNLMFALIWGILGLLWVRSIFPVMVSLVGKIPVREGKIIACVFAVLFLANGALSALAVHRWSERKSGGKAANGIERFIDAHYQDEVMARIYPNMRFVD